MQRVTVLMGLLVGLCAAPAAFAKNDGPVMGVVEFKNEATGVSWWGSGVGWDLAGMLSNELASTKAFRIVERSKLQAVIEEQNLAANFLASQGLFSEARRPSACCARSSSCVHPALFSTLPR